MDCTTTDSAKELQRKDDDKATTSNINSNVVLVNDDVMEEVNINLTTSGTSCTNVIIEKCLDKKIDDQDEMTEMPSLPTMMIVKGKRTKRQRIPITGENKCSSNNYQEDNVQVVMTDEDEEMDMANCLILLAQGPARPPLIRRNDQLGLFTSDNKRPSYNNSSVYECKTCSRTFTSFQALGGHRASHKKLKIATTNTTTADNDHSFSQMVTVATSSSLSPLTLQLGNINYTTTATAVAAAAPPTPTTNSVAQNYSSNKNRIHECAVCGAEFSSGQALGGHMRRHRGPLLPLHSSTTATTTNKHPYANTTLSLSTAANKNEVESKVNRMSDGFLSLDLNLSASPSPLAPTAELDETKLSKQHPQTSSGMVLSTPALVDCLY